MFQDIPGKHSNSDVITIMTEADDDPVVLPSHLNHEIHPDGAVQGLFFLSLATIFGFGEEDNMARQHSLAI